MKMPKSCSSLSGYFREGEFLSGTAGSWHSGTAECQSAASEMHRETGIDLVATNDVHYTLAEDAQPHDVLLCLQTGKKLADEDRMRYEGGQYYVKSPEEMERLFPYAPERLRIHTKIAQRCHVEIEFGGDKSCPKILMFPGKVYTSWGISE